LPCGVGSIEVFRSNPLCSSLLDQAFRACPQSGDDGAKYGLVTIARIADFD